ncbi:glycine zipper 2TM domain-containing protein [Halothiobacillus sp.]|jgi:outer membrane lipoprotein SlyB|uniref:glycine zipper 2TM domain-containing protein n=1 Tax=Halothiobacillus sp. TaxID=1891311 RepID=UPI002606DC41|nr:glycine zipper 2TM domain-containing protein [Halothiobacillus sp.]MDD3575874.1 glycine zipper 2TM domain-containing protein [Halothiobacillus sp.]MDD4965489.1 glycine zipper 2TM domain-containing protein [Halothiobacillus sp.]MDY0147378.1 glycine zipper 2TM domain-containing protein [Halothiobacillus sp.]
MRAQSSIKWAVPIIMLAALTGCVTPMSGDVYSRNNAMQMQTVQYGTIESLRGVRIAGTKTPIGAIGGAVVGGLLGSGVGGGLGRDLATVGGAIGGGVAGSAIEEGVTQQNGVEIVVRLDNGRTVSIVQAVGGQIFSLGQRVQVITAPDGTSRVTAG